VTDDKDDGDGGGGFLGHTLSTLRSARSFMPEDSSVLRSVELFSTEPVIFCCTQSAVSTVHAAIFRPFFRRKMCKLYTAQFVCRQRSPSVVNCPVVLRHGVAYFQFFTPGRWILDWSAQWSCLGCVTVASKGTFVFVLVPVARIGVLLVVVTRSALNQLNIFSIPILWRPI